MSLKTKKNAVISHLCSCHKVVDTQTRIMNRNVRPRLRLVCPGCEVLCHSSRSYTSHLMNNSFCLAVDQWGVNINQPSSHQTIDPGQNTNPIILTKATIPYQNVTDNYNANLDDPLYPEEDVDDSGDIEFEPNVLVDNLPEPTVCSFGLEKILSDRSHTSKVFSKETRCFVKLLHKLMLIGSPLYFFDDIIKWAVDATMAGVTFHSNMPSREKIMSDLEKRFKTSSMKPQYLPYQLEGKGFESLPVFNFKAMLASLLNDERLMQPENLVIQPDNPVQFQDKYSLDTLEVDELHTGTVCRNCIKETCTGPKDVFVGIVMYIDGTNLGNFTNASLEPVMFSLSIFNRETRNQSHAWRPLGYVKRPVDNVTDQDEGIDALKGRNNRNYHRALRLLLKDLIAVQKDDGYICDLIIGDHANRNMHLKLKLVCVIGDCEGADHLCSRYASHSRYVTSLCRDCKCLTEDADRTDLECVYRQRIDFFNATDEELKYMSHYKCNNVFDDIDMCDNAGGISLASPPEILHWKNLGLDKMAILHFNEKVLGNGQNAKTFDDILGMVSKACQHQSDRNMHIVTFNKGFTAMTKKHKSS